MPRTVRTSLVVPLSLGQERVFRLARLNPGEPLYNVTAAYRLAGALDPEALARATRRIAQRHEALRSTFWQEGDAPVCAISAEGDAATFERSDLSGLPVAEREGALMRLLEVEAGRSFDLAEGPLWRLHVATLDDADHALCLTMHHIVTDGWSFAVFFKELGELYGAERDGREAALPELKAGYGDFAAHHRELVGSDACANQLAYWAERFATPALPLQLPGAANGRASSDRHCDVVPFDLSEDATRALSAFSQKERVTLFMTLLAAFAALLSRASGQSDLLLVTPVSGRHIAKTRHLIGYFNNLLPLRLDLTEAVSLQDVLAAVRTAALDGYRNQDVPFLTISALPGLRGIPLSRLLFSLDMPWPPDFALEGIDCAPISLDTGTADFDLGLSLWLRDDRIHGTLRYKAALFDPATMTALARNYVEAIEAIAREPDSAIAALPLDTTLAATLPAAPATSQTDSLDHSILPRDAFELKVAQEWEAAFRKAPIGVHEDLASLGASSLAVADLAERIHRAFGTEVPLSAIFQADTVRKMTILLRSNNVPASRSPIAAIRAQGSKRPLFLCEGAGIYYPLAARLGPDQPVYALFSDFDGAYGGVKDLAARYLKAVREVQPQGPYQLGGISFGGLVAFEMARQLKLAGQQVALLALFDTPGPGAYIRKGRIGVLMGHLSNALRFGLPYARRVLGQGAARSLRQVTGADDRVMRSESRNQEQIRVLFQDKADSYRVDPYPGRITLFMLGHRDGMTDSLFDPALGHVDPYLGWQAVAEDGVDRHLLDGEHVTILKEPFVADLARLLEGMLV